MGHPGVEEVAVVAAPDRRYGEVPAAFVVASTEAPPTESELVETLQMAGVARQKTPVHWFFVEELPVNSSGKVKKFELVNQIPSEPGVDA